MQFILKILSLLLAVFLCGFWNIIDFLSPNNAVLSIRANLAMDIEESRIEFHEDTHGGFHGDGEEIIIFLPDSAEIYKIYHQWQKTPIDSEIAPFLFCEEEYNGIDLREYILNTDGWWLYKNRGDALYSYNFSFAFFDGERVYYYELDT